MKTLEIVALAASAYILLTKTNLLSASGFDSSGGGGASAPGIGAHPATSTPSPATMAATLAAAQAALAQVGAPAMTGYVPTVAPTTQAGLIASYTAQGVGGASAPAVAAEIANANISGAHPTANYTPSYASPGVVWTGAGYYNSFTGVTHIPTTYGGSVGGGVNTSWSTYLKSQK